MRKVLDFLIGALIVVMVALVGYVCYVVYDQHKESQHALNTIDGVIKKIEKLDTSKGQGYVCISKEDLKNLVEARVTDNSGIMDINSFISIMLTLITLCLTCSAIIPYVVAKFISEAKIKDTVEDIYARDKALTDKQFRQSLEKLEVAEAHLSRMTAYNLKKIDDIRRELTHGVTDGYDYSVHAVWTIGWASKALLRYMRNVDSQSARHPEVSKFCENCVTYIKQSVVRLKNTSSSNDLPDKAKDKALRAVTDILDVILYYKSKAESNGLNVIVRPTDIDVLPACARTLYLCIDEPKYSVKWPSDDNLKTICDKSKYKQYLKDDDGNVASAKYFRREVVKILK